MVTIDQVIAQYLDSWYYNEWPIGNFVGTVIALILSFVLCGVIGVERERRGRSAGLRTHLLVGVGSCIIMIISIYGFPQVFNKDVARLAAQIITGVGFLGAGAIIHRNSGTKGLTTAATIWIVMAIGLACGSFNFILAIMGTLLIVVVLTVFRKFETKLTKKTPLITLTVDSKSAVLSRVLEVAQQFDCTINDLQSEIDDAGDIELTFLAISNTNEFETTEFIARLGTIEGVKRVGVMNLHK